MLFIPLSSFLHRKILANRFYSLIVYLLYLYYLSRVFFMRGYFLTFKICTE